MGFDRKTQGDNAHLGNLTGGRMYHIDGSVTTPITVRSTPGRLLRVALNTNGSTLTLRDGASKVIAVIASDAPEQIFPYGVYCDTSIVVVAGGALDATIVFAD